MTITADQDRPRPDRGVIRRSLPMFAALLGFNTLAWIWALSAFHGQPMLLGTAALAYVLGLRHAIDADHIAAIDNITRKLMQGGGRPVGVGLFFSLGHSTVVVLACIGLALMGDTLHRQMPRLQAGGAIVGTTISAIFLFAVAAINLGILATVWQTFRRVRNGEPYIEGDLDIVLSNSGLLSRILKPLYRLIGASWHMYPLGFLFGLGFDTASEIGLLGISAAQASQGAPVWIILIFPALFTAGMTLLDTADSIAMVGAYSWAFVKPVRKLYYNMAMTLLSVIIALGVGGIEALGLISDHLQHNTGPWRQIAALSDHAGIIGVAIISFFVASWALAALIYSLRGYDRLNRLSPY